MKLITSNPYRILGLIVNASAAQKNRHITRIPHYIDASDDIPDEFTTFSFPVLGDISLTIQSVSSAASKLTLDSDKINSSLFWFWNGNSITDEFAFDALKDNNPNDAIETWRKLIYNSEGVMNEVSARNASAFFNLSTLFLVKNGIDVDTLQLKLLFLESDFVKEFKSAVTDEKYKIEKGGLQLIFLNNLVNQNDTDKNKVIKAISNIEFYRKKDFLEGFIQKPIEQIEIKIEATKNKRKAIKANAAKYGQELYMNTANDLSQLKSIVGSSDIIYTSISDKVANEILQCSIDFFNDNKEKQISSDYEETAMKLAKQAETLAIGKLTKDRVIDSIETLAEMKDKELTQAITALQTIKDAYDQACRQIDNQVEELQNEIIPGIGGGPALIIRKHNFNINWGKVQEMKDNCLDWDKVTEVVSDAIPCQNINKIKQTKNTKKLSEYKILVNFLLIKLSAPNKDKIAYINYWDTSKINNDPQDYTIWYVAGTVLFLAILEYSIWETFWLIGILIFIIFSSIGK